VHTLKKKLIYILPFVMMPVFIPVYNILDHLIFVDVFGCGCVPIAQTNMLNIAFNANDLRRLVFFLLAAILSIWSVIASKHFTKKIVRVIYCVVAVMFNLVLAIWVIKTFMWA
jgi:hypothetical protein